MSLMKKDIETVRHFALRVQQLVKKGWCNESAATINLKNNEIFTKGLPKKLKDFAHKRQVKPVSTLLEPSIPFHTLVRHVDSEDIANEKIGTNDLVLEINKVSIEDNDHNKESESDQIMVTQSGDPNNESRPAYRKFCSYCHKSNHSISNCYQKQRDDEYQKYKNQRSRTPQQSFVQYFRSKPSISQENKNENRNGYYSRNNDCNKNDQNDYTYYKDRYRSNSRDYSQNNYRSNSRQRYYNRSPFHIHLDRDMTTIMKKELHLDPHIDRHIETVPIIDTILVQDIDLVLNHKEFLLNDTIIHIDLHQDQEIIDQDREHPHKTDNKIE